jgi:creatinine amidohydrolase
MTLRKYEQLIWTEVAQVLLDHILIIPVGSLEQHGPHLPLGVDTMLANKICENVGINVGAVIAPAISYGSRSLPTSGGGYSYPGTIYLTGNTITEYYAQIVQSFVFAGARKMLFLNAHWENEPFLVEAVERCRENKYLNGVNIIVTSWWNIITDAEMIDIFGSFPGWHAEHAGQAETSLMCYYMPQCVKMENLEDCNSIIPAGIYRYPVPSGWSGCKGVLSKASHASLEMGKRLAEIIETKLISLVKEWELD